MRLVEVARFFVYGYTRRNIEGHLIVMIQVAGIILVLWMIGGWVYLPLALVGSILNAAVVAGVGQLPVDLNGLMRSKWKDFFVAFPMRPLEFAVGFSVGASSLRLVGALLLVLILSLVRGLAIIQIIEVLLLLASTWLDMIALGFYMGLRLRDPMSLRRVSDAAVLLLTFFSPVFFPMDFIPMPLKLVALASPTTPAAVLMRNVIGLPDGLGILPIEGYLTLHLFYLILFLLLSVRYARWVEE